MKRLLWLLVALFALLGGVWLYFKLFPGDETRIRFVLAEVQRYASFNGSEPDISRLANVRKLSGYFANDVVISLRLGGESPREIDGRENLQQVAMGARNALSSLQVEFSAPQIQLAADHTGATVNLTVRAAPSGSDPQVQSLKLTLKKFEGRWFIARIEAGKPLNFKAF